MRSFAGKFTMAAACAGLAIALTAGSALAGDRDHRGGYDRDRSSHYERDYGRHNDRDYDRGGRDYRPHYVVGGYRPVHPVYVERPCYDSDYVYERPCADYVYPVYRERVVVRPSHRFLRGLGIYLGW